MILKEIVPLCIGFVAKGVGPKEMRLMLAQTGLARVEAAWLPGLNKPYLRNE